MAILLDSANNTSVSNASEYPEYVLLGHQLGLQKLVKLNPHSYWARIATAVESLCGYIGGQSVCRLLGAAEQGVAVECREVSELVGETKVCLSGARAFIL